ncbi:MAG: tetratricopeptide repeat protein [Candidatus Cloacimonetes bacterium]|nr:tetratricopeptide repeat protein [Candidatus Cloacimonadota bacterium]
MKTTIAVFIMLAASALAAQNTLELMTESYDFETISRYDAAIRSMQQLVEIEPDNAFHHLRLGWLYYASGQYAAAERHYALAADIEPVLEALEGRMNSASAQQKWSQAVAAADEVLKRFPNHFYALASKAYAFYMQGEFEQAVSFYRKALTIYPYNLEAMGYLLSAQMLNGDTQGGQKTLAKLQPLSPANAFVLEYAQ